MPLGFDWSPVLRVALTGIAVAFGPLSWVWLRHRHQSPAKRLRALTLLTLFLTFDLVLFGAFTRLTDSGLCCPDWPGCYGHASPLGAVASIAQAEQAMPTGPVTHSKAWIEMLHRYMATGVGVLIITLTVARWRERRTSDSLPSLWWPVLALLAVCGQGAFGALTVTMKLFPAIVTLHLLGGLLLIALLAAQSGQYDRSVNLRPAVRVSRGLYAALLLTGLLLLAQITLGGWVSTNYAVLACREFPSCQGSWWPVMDFQHGFTVWRALGLTGETVGGEAVNLSFAALTAIHYTHRLMAYGVLVALAAMAWKLYRSEGLQRQGRALAWLAALQLLTGLSNVVLDWPLIAALAHTGGAAALVGVLVWVLTACQPAAVGISMLAPVPQHTTGVTA